MSSQSNEVLYRLLMPPDLFIATIEGNRDVLIPRLGLDREPDEPTDHVQTPHLLRTVQTELRSATHFGDTVLHLLLTRRHNDLALKVFQRNRSLLKEKNKMLETPLHSAARAGNSGVTMKLFQIDPLIVMDVLHETNKAGDTVLHVATKHSHVDCVREFMTLNLELVHQVNNEKLSPIRIAITKGYTELVIHFMEGYPDYAQLLDTRERNIFHIAAEENNRMLFLEVFKRSFANKEMVRRMNNAVDYDGNTPMHIAAKKGHTSIVRDIWESKRSRIDIIAETVLNNEGLTPFEVSRRQLEESSKHWDGAKISKYLRTEGHIFTVKWFDIVGPPIPDKWEQSQVIGLGSVLIITVAFAAAFTIPGGYNQDTGTPILGRKYIFRTFIIANSLALIQGFLSLFALLGNATKGSARSGLVFAKYTFVLAASSMVLAFGFGMYVTLASISLPLAIIILVVTLFLAFALFNVDSIGQKWVQVVYNIGEYIPWKSGIWIMSVTMSVAIILGLALL